ncbi:MAG: 6-bladed beta-propeller [bacterium]|nr:6-bladed beta-propeller [bacterium]
MGIIPAVMWATEKKEPGFKELKHLKTFPAENEKDVWFKSPAVIDVDDEGNVYAFDPNNHHSIYRMDANGKLLLKIGKRGRGPGDLYHPKQIRVRDGKIFIKDRHGMAIFDLHGEFIGRFRVFSRVISFDVCNDKIYMVQSGRGKLFKVYSLDGKKLDAFGKRYDFDYSLFAGQGEDYIAGSIHKGYVICCADRILFFAEHFGDLHQYDYKGKRIRLDGVESFSPKFAKGIGKNRKLFFETGLDRDESITTVGVFGGIYCLEKKGTGRKLW